jgi:hypothetical protein
MGIAAAGTRRYRCASHVALHDYDVFGGPELLRGEAMFTMIVGAGVVSSSKGT